MFLLLFHALSDTELIIPMTLQSRQAGCLFFPRLLLLPLDMHQCWQDLYHLCRNCFRSHPIQCCFLFIVFNKKCKRKQTKGITFLNCCRESPQLPVPHLAHHSHQASRQISAKAQGFRLGLWQHTSSRGWLYPFWAPRHNLTVTQLWAKTYR